MGGFLMYFELRRVAFGPQKRIETVLKTSQARLLTILSGKSKQRFSQRKQRFHETKQRFSQSKQRYHETKQRFPQRKQRFHAARQRSPQNMQRFQKS